MTRQRGGNTDTRFTFRSLPVVGEDDLAYARMYEVSLGGRVLGVVRQGHSRDWSWDGIDLIADVTATTRQLAAERLLARVGEA